MDFQTAVRTVLLEKYATFSGRAPRSEFWWFFLFSILCNVVLSFIDRGLFGGMAGGEGVGILGALFSLAVLLPSIAVGVRRMHDQDRTGWWLLIAFVPLIGALVLLYFYVQKGTEGPNQYGPDPLAGQTA